MYIRTLFYFKFVKNKKGKTRNKKKLIEYSKEMRETGIELTFPGYRGLCSNHCPMEDFQFSQAIFPIHRRPIFIINLNTDKTVSRQSKLLVCLLAVLTHEDFRLVSSREKNVETVRTS